MFADIVITKKAYDLDRLFCYAVPEEIRNLCCPGKRVIVPFGKNSLAEGIIVSLYGAKPDIKNIKEIEEILDDYPVITEVGFKLASFIKEKYITTYFDALRLNMPSGLKTFIKEKIYLRDFDYIPDDPKDNLILDALLRNNGCNFCDLKEYIKLKDLRPRLQRLSEENVIEIKGEYENSIKEKKVEYIKLNEDFSDFEKFKEENKRKKNSVKAIELLKDNNVFGLTDLRKITNISKKALEELKEKNIVYTFEKEVTRNLFEKDYEEEDVIPSLTDEQKKAVDEIVKGKESTYLLYGVTGSGKTEVYMQVVDKTLKENKNAIILVPEISLTPQMTERFIRRFKNKVAVIHSGLSKEERYDRMKLIEKGKINLVIGARSALFAPIKNVGVIIIDEEHENSYKSDITPKYDTIEVAKERARIEKAKLILASATPSVVSFYNAKNNEYKLVTLKERINKMMPETKVCDMRKELQQGNFSPISKSLKEEIEENLKNKEQTLLFLNRRGYSTFVSCRNCGFVAKCPHCDVSLTYHSSGKMVCHYCGYEQPMFKECPDCKSKYIKFFGKGTEKIEEELHKIFPDASIIRMDKDTTTKKFSHKKILEKFEKENIDILLGTQMITKGLDFKNVTLSAVLAADGGLYLDDYRSNERTFSQITQVMGRSGRGKKKGRGIIQTYSPDHYVIKLAEEGNYEKFYNTEIILRKKMQFPPFCDIINIVCQSADIGIAKSLIKDTEKELLKCKRSLKLSDEELRIYRPGPAPLPRIKDKYRMRILLKAQNSDKIRPVLEKIYASYNMKYDNKKVGLSIDVNPINML